MTPDEFKTIRDGVAAAFLDLFDEKVENPVCHMSFKLDDGRPFVVMVGIGERAVQLTSLAAAMNLKPVEIVGLDTPA